MPQWPPHLHKGGFSDPQYEITRIEAPSVAFVTDRILKLDITSILDKKAKEPAQAALKDLVRIHEELASGDLVEFDWSRLSKLEFQELLRQRIGLTDRISKLGCQLCKDFEEHYDIVHERKLVEANLIALKLSLSDQNLELLPDYESRVEVLKELQFVDQNSTVLLKGRVACEINSAHELILTELILENVLASYTAEEAVALLSVFVFVEKTDSEPKIEPKLLQGLDTIYRIADEVENCQLRRHVAFEDFREKFKPGLVEVVYEWARGMVGACIRSVADPRSRSVRSPTSPTSPRALLSVSSPA